MLPKNKGTDHLRWATLQGGYTRWPTECGPNLFQLFASDLAFLLQFAFWNKTVVPTLLRIHPPSHVTGPEFPFFCPLEWSLVLTGLLFPDLIYIICHLLYACLTENRNAGYNGWSWRDHTRIRDNHIIGRKFHLATRVLSCWIVDGKHGTKTHTRIDSRFLSLSLSPSSPCVCGAYLAIIQCRWHQDRWRGTVKTIHI